MNAKVFKKIRLLQTQKSVETILDAADTECPRHSMKNPADAIMLQEEY